MKFTHLSAAMLVMLLSTKATAQLSAPENDNVEICVGRACALPVEVREFSGTLYLVKSHADYETLANVWTRARFFIATEADYSEIKKDRETLEFNIETLDRAKKPASAPLVSGTVNININAGGASCADCHTGSWKEIHSGALLPKKPDRGQ